MSPFFGYQRTLSLTEESTKIILYALEKARVDAVQRRIKASDDSDAGMHAHWTVRIAEIDRAIEEVRA